MALFDMEQEKCERVILALLIFIIALIFMIIEGKPLTFKWLRELKPRVKVVLATDENKC